jgi:magnesium chelatase subunit I
MDWNHVIIHPGNEELKRFVEMGVLAAQLGIPLHFHVEGVRGTGKTTLIRGARTLFPAISRVRGCLYNCDPQEPHCPQHRRTLSLPAESVPMPFLEISHSAKVGTVVGSIDLDRLTAADNPEAALLPGTIPRANRGVIFVDEVNRLADTSPPLVDVLLDVMGTKPGRVQIEETGLPNVEMPVNVSVWAASNPDEEPGPLQEIRRQLADRFDFSVRIERPQDAQTVLHIMRAQEMQTLPTAVVRAGQGRPLPALTDSVDAFLGDLYVRFRLESIRGVQAIRLGTQLHALLQGRDYADYSDMAAVLPAALRHRVSPSRMQEIADAMRNAVASVPKNEPPLVKPRGEVKKSAPRYPAFWKGLWQRMSSQGKSGGKTVRVDNQAIRQPAPSAEKKTAAPLKEPEETGSPAK